MTGLCRLSLLTAYSGFGITASGTHFAKWLFRQERATFHHRQKRIYQFRNRYNNANIPRAAL